MASRCELFVLPLPISCTHMHCESRGGLGVKAEPDGGREERGGGGQENRAIGIPARD